MFEAVNAPPPPEKQRAKRANAVSDNLSDQIDERQFMENREYINKIIDDQETGWQVAARIVFLHKDGKLTPELKKARRAAPKMMSNSQNKYGTVPKAWTVTVLEVWYKDNDILVRLTTLEQKEGFLLFPSRCNNVGPLWQIKY